MSGARKHRRINGVVPFGCASPWQEIQRGMVNELSHGIALRPAVTYHRIAAKGAKSWPMNLRA